MRKATVILLVLSLIVAPVVMADSPERWDGSVWASMELAEKVAFVAGIVAGANVTLNFMGLPLFDGDLDAYVEKIDLWYSENGLDRAITSVVDDVINEKI